MKRKSLFDHSNICQPKLIISDESWVFIIAALIEFKTETLKDFCNELRMVLLEKNDKRIVHQKVKRFCSHHY